MRFMEKQMWHVKLSAVTREEKKTKQIRKQTTDERWTYKKISWQIQIEPMIQVKSWKNKKKKNNDENWIPYW